MASDKHRKSFLEGYKAGLNAAWNEMIKLASRGYSSTELGIMAKTKLAVIHRDVEAMATRLAEEGEAAGDDKEDEIAERGSYLVNEEKAESVFVYFRDLVRAGARGLLISRTHPADVIRRLQLRDVESIWLSRTPGKARGDVAVADPTDLVTLAGAVIKFLEAGGNAAVAMEGLEYLVSLNGFQSVLRFAQTLNEKVVVNDSYFLISANADAMKDLEYKLLAKEMAGEL